MNKKIEFYGAYGNVLRTSAIFYYIQGDGYKTTISFMNYWKAKRDISVSLAITIRDMKGNELLKEFPNFKTKEVINFSKRINTDFFEGSIEIEAFSEKENLFIPYAAVMAIYEGPDSISLTHSYARSYEQREIDEGIAITDGNEGCWTLRDNEETKSFGIFHNGDSPQEEQTIKLEIRNYKGEIKTSNWKHKKLAPYETTKIYPSDKIKNLISFLDNKEGSARISFKLNKGFTRMLVGNKRIGKYNELQTAHGNFDYSVKKQDSIKNIKSFGSMLLPNYELGKQEVLLYPEYSKGNYSIKKNDEKEFHVSDNNRKLIKVNSNGGKITIKREDGGIPSRFVTGFSAKFKEDKLPLEVSRGIRHEGEPPKRFWWGTCIASKKLNSRIILNPYLEFGKGHPNGYALFKLYSAYSKKFLEKKYTKFPYKNFIKGVKPENIFSENVNDFLKDDYGYFTFFSHYTMFDCLVIVENDDKKGMEHCF